MQLEGKRVEELGKSLIKDIQEHTLGEIGAAVGLVFISLIETAPEMQKDILSMIKWIDKAVNQYVQEAEGAKHGE